MIGVFMDGLTVAGLVALPIAGAGFVASVIGAAKELLDWLTARRIMADTQQTAIIEDGLRDTLIDLDRKIHYRHNLHCPKCGRFAARVPGMPDSVTHCKHHGTWLRSETGGSVSLDIHFVKYQIRETPPLEIEAPKRELDELDTGVILLPNLKICDYCDGTGEIMGYINEFEMDSVDCPECDGKGEVLVA